MAETGMWAYIYFGHEIWFIHVYVAQFFFSLVGEPRKSPDCVYIQTGGQTSGLHMNLRLPWATWSRKPLTSWVGFCKCALVLHTFLFWSHTSYITHSALFSPVPTRPPTLRSLYHPLTWLHTNEILHTGSIISGFCWGFFFFLHPHGMSEELPCPLFLRQAQFILMMQQIQSRKIKQQFQWPQLLVLDDRDALDFVFVCLYRAFCLL